MKAFSMSFVAVVGLLLLVAGSILCHECRPRDEGHIVEKNCKGFTRCVNRIAVTFECESGLVFDIDDNKCVLPKQTKLKCNICEGRPDGIYPESHDNCRTYFVCTNSESSKRQSCPYVYTFDVIQGKCEHPKNLEPPCGYKGVKKT